MCSHRLWCPVTIRYIPSTLRWISTIDQMTSTSRNTETSQYLPHTTYNKNAAKKARRNPEDPHSHILQPKTSNIYANAAQEARRNEKSRRPTQQARGSTKMLCNRPGEMRNPGDPRSRPEDLRKCCAADPEKWEIQETHSAGPRIVLWDFAVGRCIEDAPSVLRLRHSGVWGFIVFWCVEVVGYERFYRSIETKINWRIHYSVASKSPNGVVSKQ